MRAKIILVLTIIATLALCLAMVQPATAASDEEEILQLQSNFLRANSTGDYALMSTLYWHSPNTKAFTPGNPPLLLEGWDESIGPYWKLSSATTATKTLFLHPRVTFLKDDIAVINGYEYFEETDSKTNEVTTSQVRVTRIVQKIGGKWLIVNEHASVLPEE